MHQILPFYGAMLVFVFTIYCPPIHAEPHHGEASVYADKFHGKKTASGETFNQNELTAASKTLPLGSTAKVTNKKTGKSINVKITDRGPFVKGRSIDLSKAAAKAIGMDEEGTSEVIVEKTGKASQR